MIAESAAIVALALGIDLVFGDPRNRYHPTAWIGAMIARLVPLSQHQSAHVEKLGGVILILLTAGAAVISLWIVEIGATAVSILALDAAGSGTLAYLIPVIPITVEAVLLKLTIAARGMERHAMSVMDSLGQGNINSARADLSGIVKRDTANMDEDHVVSGVLESVSENTVDGVTGPLFYYALFGLVGAFVYRVINTADSMIGYRTDIFTDMGWFAASCDTVLNYIPARITGLVMVVSAAILRYDWKESYRIMMRDGKKTSSRNAGYPMAALAGALGIRLEKIGHYSIGDSRTAPTRRHVRSAIAMMKLSSLLFFGIIVVPMISALYMVWWIHV